MTQARFSSVATSSVLGLCLALSSRAAPAATTGPDSAAAWQVEAGASYGSSGEFSGWGGAMRATWLANRYLALGAGIDSVHLHAEGMALRAPFSQTFETTLFAALLQGRLPLGIVAPYAEVGLGYVDIANASSDNSECNYVSGAGLSLAAGADVRISGTVSAGVRWAMRNTGAGLGCAAELGPWGFEMKRLQTLGVTAAYRF